MAPLNKRVSINSTGFKLSKAGFDADTTTPDNLLFTSEFKSMRVWARGSRTFTNADLVPGDSSISITLPWPSPGFTPWCLWWFDQSWWGSTIIREYNMMGDHYMKFPHLFVSHCIKVMSTGLRFDINELNGGLNISYSTPVTLYYIAFQNPQSAQ